MSDTARELTTEDYAELQKKFSEIKHSVNNALAVMMALSEMSQRRPDYAEKLATTVLAKAPQIVSSLQEFTQALNEKVGPRPEGMPRGLVVRTNEAAHGGSASQKYSHRRGRARRNRSAHPEPAARRRI